MKKLILITICIGIQNAMALDPQSVKTIVEKSIKDHQKIENTGVSISVFTKNNILLQQGFGFKNREANQAVTAKTLFAIGSTTKAFTALDLKLLENRHVLNLSDKVQTHLPAFRLSNDMITKEATIEDLLSHRIGLPRHDLLWYYSPFSRRDLFDRLQYLDFPARVEENFRKTFQYNNLLVMTAGIIVEEKSAMSWEDFTQKNILDKLQMNATRFGVPEDMEQLDIATPYNEEIKLKHRDIAEVGPAGSIYSNAEDMTKWIQSFMKNTWSNQDDFFKARIALPNGENSSMDYAYGLAWMINSMNKQYTWAFHGGNIDGFSTLVLFSPELDLGVITLINQDSSALPNDIITDLISAAIKEKGAVHNKSFINISKKISFYNPESMLFSMNDKEVSVDKIETFHHPGYGDISLISKDGELFASYYSATWKLRSLVKDNFNYSGAGDFEIGFHIENDFVEVPFEEQVSNIHFTKSNL